MRFARAALLAFGLIFGCAAHSADLDQIIANGTLRACFARIDPALIRTVPADCTHDCVFEGLIVDQVTAFAATLDGVTLEPRIVSWNSQFENELGVVNREATYVPRLLSDGTCDLYVSNLAVLPWRLNKMHIAPLFESRMIALVRRERRTDFLQLSDFAGARMAVTPNASFHTWAQNMNAGQFARKPIRFPELNDRNPLDMVLEGSADFTVTDADIAVFSVKKYGDALSPAFSVGPVQKLGWGLHPKASNLETHITTFFDAQRNDPRSELNTAWEQHVGVTILDFEALVSALPSEPPQKVSE